jgi:eukaryotic-like serine/threonine-protein kinase
MSTDPSELSDALGGTVAAGDVVAGKYRVDRLVGTGGMGVVVEAFHLNFEERVAIKFLLPQMGADGDAIERFEREARSAFKIKSEHVARVIDVGKIDRVPFMVMEYLEGKDLGDLLVDRKPMPIDRAVGYVLQAVDAVAEAHSLNIVHRDLKPENLFLTTRADGSECIKVLDFGLSKIHAGEVKTPRARALTASSQAMGTPQYMSPEQWMSARDVGPPTDQWALAVIVYELITGHQPFHREHLAQLCTQVLRGEAEPFETYRDDVPDALQQVVWRALSKQPDDRYPNLAALAIDLVPFAPAMKATVRRIKGIFQRLGVDTAEIPSSRRGGLGSLVLGGAPSDSDPAPSPSRAPAIPRPTALSAPDAPKSAPAFPSVPSGLNGLGAPRPSPSGPGGPPPSGAGIAPPSAPSGSGFAPPSAPSSPRLPPQDEATVVMAIPSRPTTPAEVDMAPTERLRTSNSDVTQLLAGPLPSDSLAQTTVMTDRVPAFTPPPALPGQPAGMFPQGSAPDSSGQDAPTLVAQPPPWQTFQPPPDRRLPLVIAAAVLMCVLAVVAVIVSVSGADDSTTQEQAE